MDDTSGFYKLSNDGELYFGPNFVVNKNYELKRELKNNYQYPVGGWYWFDSRDEALLQFGLDQEHEDGEWIPV
jgi:hypothetical protein